MTASHHADGPGGRAPSGPGSRDTPFANDNPPAVAGAVGLALSAEHRRDGTPVLAIRPVLAGGGLGDAVHVAGDDPDIIALWRGLGRDLNLALYLRDQTGATTPVAPQAGRGAPRRRGSPLAARRPRFLTRRKVPGPEAPAGASPRRREG
ncbi:hypothetical protein [Rhabdaerophilum calidifontis]|uniref:hypothetical protein n=1 Tax=Rhabdaerophilum calidifontis TaxID=2604328 RepID=UPI00123C5EA9|nr:hypothetical protein [Rhabdaerophilum calidifontis]